MGGRRGVQERNEKGRKTRERGGQRRLSPGHLAGKSGGMGKRGGGGGRETGREEGSEEERTSTLVKIQTGRWRMESREEGRKEGREGGREGGRDLEEGVGS
jgi:hypothetical protein